MMSYTPKPIDLCGIALSEDLAKDVEIIAKDVHEVWAKKRIDNGEGEDHPCMVEYEKLPESKKEYGRATVVQNVKMLIHLGYEIKKGEERDV